MAGQWDVPELPTGCPWSGWTPPNIKWCEENLCEWITTPANTWSNLAFIVLGALMWRQARAKGSRTMALFGPTSILAGVFSFLYHASYTYFFQFFDFVAMFMFCMLLIVLNARRLGTLTVERQLLAFTAGVVVSSLLVPLFFQVGIPIQILVLALVAIVLLQERSCSKLPDNQIVYRHLHIALVLAFLAATCSVLDITRTVCVPDQHWVHGHALWHLLMAVSLYELYRFYDQFRFD